MTLIIRMCMIVVMICLGAQVRAQDRVFDQGKEVGRIQFTGLDEISGMAVSRKNPGVFWVHNDSGDRAQIYAIDVRGRLLSTFLVTGAVARDWEDIAIGPGPEANESYIYIADTGDNNAKRPSVTVYRVAEPAVSLIDPVPVDRTARAEAISLTYPGGPRDAETLFVDPTTKDVYIISKRELSNGLYCAPYPQLTEGTAVLQFKTELPIGFSVGGDISADGRFVLVRSMFGAAMFERITGKPLWEAFKGKPVSIPVKSEPQGEAIAFDIEGRGYYTVSEGKRPPIYYYERIKDAD